MKFTGGPVAGKSHNVQYHGGTLQFCLYGQCGRYNASGVWEPAPGPEQARALGYPVAVEPLELRE